MTSIWAADIQPIRAMRTVIESFENIVEDLMRVVFLLLFRGGSPPFYT